MTEFDKKGSEAARAAWLYYHEELTQSEIAQELSISRSTVTRLLQRAKSEGLVQISLNVTSGTFKTERELEQRYGLKRVRIVPDAADEATQKRWLGHAAAELMISMVKDNSIIAVSWGTTLLAMADSLIGQHPLTNAQVVAVLGGLHNAMPGADTNEVAKRLGQFFNAPVRPLLAPMSVQDEATATGLANDPGIRDALELARNASIVIYSLGSADNETTLFKLGHLDAGQWDFLKRHGAVGDIACRWIDAKGDPVALPPSINPIGIDLDEIRKIPDRLAVVGGAYKSEIALAGLRGGFVTALVTDERTAAFLLTPR